MIRAMLCRIGWHKPVVMRRRVLVCLSCGARSYGL